MLLALISASAAEYACPTVPPAGVSRSDCDSLSCPNINGGSFKFIGGREVPHDGKVTTVMSPIFDLDTNERMPIGSLPDMLPEEATAAVEAAAAAWDQGQGVWPRMSLAARISAIEKLVVELTKVREQMVQALMWEIAKSSKDAASEFDRTMGFIAAAIAELRKDPSVGQGFSQWEVVSGVGVRVRRGPIGVMLGLAPFNCACAADHPSSALCSRLTPGVSFARPRLDAAARSAQ